jgi:DNA sulfur modification protein DndC
VGLNLFKQNTKFEDAKSLVKEVYLADDRPWVVGYSGGKDSTVVAQLVFTALSELESSLLTKKVYVISSDTLVETPMIIDSITSTIGRIQDQAMTMGLPIESQKVRPENDKTFWSSIIGKGYPTPRQTFRWCTDRMKIDPANKFILDKVSKFGEVIMVLGVRDSESSTRAGVMKSHTIEGKELMKHSSLNNAFVFAPIRNFELDDVWEYLLENDSPWGDNNHNLLKLYQDSNSECPLVVDKDIKESAGSCGNSRFGCWTCTVVSEDKALSGFINSGSEWMRPLLDYRNWLASIRDKRQYRQKHRMNGQIYLTTNLENINKEECIEIHESELGDYIKKNKIDLANVEQLNLLIIDDEGNYKQLGLGPYTLKARELILRKLLKTQMEVRKLHDSSIELITIDELKEIRKFWLADGATSDNIPELYKEIVGEHVEWEYNDRPMFQEDQITDLERLCSENNVDISLLKKLIHIEKDYSGYRVRRGLHQEFNKTLKQDYLHL